MIAPVSEEHIGSFSNYLFNPESVWACFDVGDLVRFNKQVGLISTSIVYRIEEVIPQGAFDFRIRLSYYGRPRLPLLIDKCDVFLAEMRHL